MLFIKSSLLSSRELKVLASSSLTTECARFLPRHGQLWLFTHVWNSFNNNRLAPKHSVRLASKINRSMGLVSSSMDWVI